MTGWAASDTRARRLVADYAKRVGAKTEQRTRKQFVTDPGNVHRAFNEHGREGLL